MGNHENDNGLTISQSDASAVDQRWSPPPLRVAFCVDLLKALKSDIQS
jgi:hypothetical protein